MKFRVEYYNTWGEHKTKMFENYGRALKYFKEKAMNFESYLIIDENNKYLRRANY